MLPIGDARLLLVGSKRALPATLLISARSEAQCLP